MKNGSWYKSIGVTVAVLAMLLGLWSNVPFATQKDVDQLIVLKNQDNQWYREQGERIAKMEGIMASMAVEVSEIKKLVLNHQINHSRN